MDYVFLAANPTAGRPATPESPTETSTAAAGAVSGSGEALLVPKSAVAGYGAMQRLGDRSLLAVWGEVHQPRPRKSWEEEEGPARPWEWAVNAFDRMVRAANTIQRAFRQWREKCLESGWPSDENPYHWRHWSDLRQEIGWAEDELYDDYGDLVKRTDGGSRRVNKKLKLRTKPEERKPITEHEQYGDAIGYFREKYGRLPGDGDEALLAALQDYKSAVHVAQYLANKWWRMKHAEEYERLARMPNRLKDEFAEGSLEYEELKRYMLANGHGMCMSIHNPIVRDLKATLHYMPRQGQTKILDMLSQFNAVLQFKNHIKEAQQRRRATAASMDGGPGEDHEDDASYDPDHPEYDPTSGLNGGSRNRRRRRPGTAGSRMRTGGGGGGAGGYGGGPEEEEWSDDIEEPDEDVVGMYEFMIEQVAKEYKNELEEARRWACTPPEPPEGLPDDVVALYYEVLKAVEDKQQPRVCRLRKYGRQWLHAFDSSTWQRHRLLRTRSAGNLGLVHGDHPMAQPAMPSGAAPTAATDSTAVGRDMARRSTMDGLSGVPVELAKVQLRRKYIPTISSSAAWKVHKVVQAQHNRPSGYRPLQVVNTQWLGSFDWAVVDAVIQGKPRPAPRQQPPPMDDELDDLFEEIFRHEEEQEGAEVGAGNGRAAQADGESVLGAGGTRERRPGAPSVISAATGRTGKTWVTGRTAALAAGRRGGKEDSNNKLQLDAYPPEVQDILRGMALDGVTVNQLLRKVSALARSPGTTLHALDVASGFGPESPRRGSTAGGACSAEAAAAGGGEGSSQRRLKRSLSTCNASELGCSIVAAQLQQQQGQAQAAGREPAGSPSGRAPVAPVESASGSSSPTAAGKAQHQQEQEPPASPAADPEAEAAAAARRALLGNDASQNGQQPVPEHLPWLCMLRAWTLGGVARLSHQDWELMYLRLWLPCWDGATMVLAGAGLAPVAAAPPHAQEEEAGKASALGVAGGDVHSLVARGTFWGAVLADAFVQAQHWKLARRRNFAGASMSLFRQQRLAAEVQLYERYKQQFSNMQQAAKEMLFKVKALQPEHLPGKVVLSQKMKWLTLFRSDMFLWLNRYLTIGALPDSLAAKPEKPFSRPASALPLSVRQAPQQPAPKRVWRAGGGAPAAAPAARAAGATTTSGAPAAASAAAGNKPGRSASISGVSTSKVSARLSSSGDARTGAVRAGSVRASSGGGEARVASARAGSSSSSRPARVSITGSAAPAAKAAPSSSRDTGSSAAQAADHPNGSRGLNAKASAPLWPTLVEVVGEVLSDGEGDADGADSADFNILLQEASAEGAAAQPAPEPPTPKPDIRTTDSVAHEPAPEAPAPGPDTRASATAAMEPLVQGLPTSPVPPALPPQPQEPPPPQPQQRQPSGSTPLQPTPPPQQQQQPQAQQEQQRPKVPLFQEARLHRWASTQAVTSPRDSDAPPTPFAQRMESMAAAGTADGSSGASSGGSGAPGAAAVQPRGRSMLRPASARPAALQPHPPPPVSCPLSQAPRPASARPSSASSIGASPSSPSPNEALAGDYAGTVFAPWPVMPPAQYAPGTSGGGSSPSNSSSASGAGGTPSGGAAMHGSSGAGGSGTGGVTAQRSPTAAYPRARSRLGSARMAPLLVVGENGPPAPTSAGNSPDGAVSSAFKNGRRVASANSLLRASAPTVPISRPPTALTATSMRTGLDSIEVRGTVLAQQQQAAQLRSTLFFAGASTSQQASKEQQRFSRISSSQEVTKGMARAKSSIDVTALAVRPRTAHAAGRTNAAAGSSSAAGAAAAAPRAATTSAPQITITPFGPPTAPRSAPLTSASLLRAAQANSSSLAASAGAQHGKRPVSGGSSRASAGSAGSGGSGLLRGRLSGGSGTGSGRLPNVDQLMMGRWSHG